MFSETGVTEPKLDVDELSSRRQAYDGLKGALDSAQSTASDAAHKVLAANKGAAATAFQGKAVGGGGLVPYIITVRDAAGRTSTAYSDAASKGGFAKTAMIGYAKEQYGKYLVAVLTMDSKKAAQIVTESRTGLQRLETMGASDVKTAFGSLNLPAPKPLDYSQGKVDPRIATDWSTPQSQGGMSTAERQALLQAMADKYARDHGFPPVAITWGNPGAGNLGVYRPGPKTLVVDPNNLNNADIIGTVIHEMQHRGQFEGMDAYRWFWEDVKNGMSREDAERWKRYYGQWNKGDDPSTPNDDEGYWQRPFEVDARRAQADYLNQLSYDEYMAMRNPHHKPAGGGTPTMDFQPAVWKAQGDRVVGQSDSFYKSAETVNLMQALPAKTNSPIDTAAADGDKLCVLPWYKLIAGVREHLSGLGSQMVAAGTDYAATEEANRDVAARFFQ